MKKIVLAYDGSNEAEEALKWTGREAKARNASVIVVTVHPLPGEDLHPLGGYKWEFAHHLESAGGPGRRAVKYLEELGVRAELAVREGFAAEVVCELAREQEAELIVLGHRDRLPIVEWLQGSTAHAVERRALCPVMMAIPGKGITHWTRGAHTPVKG